MPPGGCPAASPPSTPTRSSRRRSPGRTPGWRSSCASTTRARTRRGAASSVQRELVIANYLQRYCLKNDTIGFFGPVGWASAGSGAPGLVVVPGERLVARRTTYFEVWAIDKVAAEIARQGRERGWLRPRRTRSVFLAGNVLHRPHRKPVVLTDAELRVLLACDGHRTISDVLGRRRRPERPRSAGPAGRAGGGAAGSGGPGGCVAGAAAAGQAGADRRSRWPGRRRWRRWSS